MITLFDAFKTFIFCILAQYKNDKDEKNKFVELLKYKAENNVGGFKCNKF